MPKPAYQVRLTGNDDDLQWIEQTPSGEKHYASEPGAGFLRRAWVGFISIFPIDWLL